MGMIGGWELLLIFFIVLILFGARRLPEIAQALGKSMNEFKKAKNDVLSYKENENKTHCATTISKKSEADVTEADEVEK